MICQIIITKGKDRKQIVPYSYIKTGWKYHPGNFIPFKTINTPIELMEIDL